MFAMLSAAVLGLTFGVIMAIFGTAILVFRADFIISGIAPEIMLFGGLTAVFFSGFIGLAAIKLGFMVSRFFLTTRRHCEILSIQTDDEEYEEISDDEEIESIPDEEL